MSSEEPDGDVLRDGGVTSVTERATIVLSRWRVGLGFLFGAIVFWLARPTFATLTAGAILAGAGEGFRIWAAGHLLKSREVTTSGPYKLCAHPLYIGSGLMGAGLALASGSASVAVLIALYLAMALPAAARRETAFLRERFGEEYQQYRSGTGDLATGERRFSFARAFANHEHRAVIGLFLSVLLLALKVRANV
jgi:protein-S-isoprenylcysteine O-methyltransferase Ste14